MSTNPLLEDDESIRRRQIKAIFQQHVIKPHMLVTLLTACMKPEFVPKDPLTRLYWNMTDTTLCGIELDRMGLKLVPQSNKLSTWNPEAYFSVVNRQMLVAEARKVLRDEYADLLELENIVDNIKKSSL